MSTSSPTSPQDGSPAVGYVFAAVFPLIGFIIGIVWAAGNPPPRRKAAGGWVILASVVAFFVWLALLSSSGGYS